jgi:hypothetical protein
MMVSSAQGKTHLMTRVARRRGIGLIGLLLAASAFPPGATDDGRLTAWAVRQGYQPVDDRGHVRYCRIVNRPNSRIGRLECLSETQLADRKRLWDARAPNSRPPVLQGK